MSGLDFAVASKNLVEGMGSFDIIYTCLKSDHKPLSVTLDTNEDELTLDHILHKSASFLSYNHLSKPSRRTKIRADD